MRRQLSRNEEFQVITIKGVPALLIDGRIDKSSVPKEMYCYDLRGRDDDIGMPGTIENHVLVNFCGSILTLANMFQERDTMNYISLTRDDIDYQDDNGDESEMDINEFIRTYKR